MMVRALLSRLSGSAGPPSQLVGAGLACLNAAGEVLMVRRHDNGLWDLPGGRVEVGEATDDAARRELREETGLDAGRLELLAVFSGPQTLHTYPDGNVVAWVTVIYTCREISGAARPGDDAAEVCWCLPDAPLGPVSAVTGAYLNLLQANSG